MYVGRGAADATAKKKRTAAICIRKSIEQKKKINHTVSNKSQTVEHEFNKNDTSLSLNHSFAF